MRDSHWVRESLAEVLRSPSLFAHWSRRGQGRQNQMVRGKKDIKGEEQKQPGWQECLALPMLAVAANNIPFTRSRNLK